MAISAPNASPTWLDWVSPGTLIAVFFGSSGPNHMPLPVRAFCVPPLRQDPSV